jgi:YidC/Oxa1 family membrane protein insertase
MQQEMMALYREAGVNPLGCLFPMLVQFPIWIALYQVIRLSLGETPESFVTLSQRLYPIDYLQTAVPLSNHLWIWNLGQNDPTYILPVIVAITMYVQQKMITPRPMATGTMTQQQLQQQQTQQMMTWMLPLMFGWISTTVPSGLALYWAVSNAAGITMQYFYAGRRLDWRNLLAFGPPAQQQPAKRIKPEAVTPGKQQPANPDPAPQNGASDEEMSVEPAGRGRSETRRKRHGRRRGKR